MTQTRYFHVAYINYFVTSNGVKKTMVLERAFSKKKRENLKSPYGERIGGG
jgi:hypothetical protein